MEIERKFTIKKLPDNLGQYPCHIIEQAYLNIDPVVRIRRQDDEYYLTYKGKGLMAREEYNLPLNTDSYYHLKKKADGNVIAKNAMSYQSNIRHSHQIIQKALTKSVCLWNWTFSKLPSRPLSSRKWNFRMKLPPMPSCPLTGLIKT